MKGGGRVAAARTNRGPPMHVAVTGSTGLIGSALVRLLVAEGHTVTRLTRSEPRGSSGSVREARWDPAAGTVDAGALAGTDALVHLAGKAISSGRWTRKVKREIRESRVRGTGLLAEVCQAWERAADPARASGLRVVHVRTGPAQTTAGGSLPRQLPLFRLGLGGRFGSGRQWWSWIALDDVVGIYRHALVTDGLEGAVNATAPNPVTNAEFTTTLARVLGRPALAPVPKLGPRLVLGEMAEELLFSSIRVQPEAPLARGYEFRWPELEPTLRHLLNRPAAA